MKGMILLFLPSDVVEGQHENGFAALGPAGSLDEIHYTAYPGKVCLGRSFGCNLASKVDDLCHIHGNHAVVACDNMGIVDIIRWMKLYGRVVVQELVKFLITQGG